MQNRNQCPRNETTKTLFADFSQGAELPYFGSEQPGETYYNSPLTVQPCKANLPKITGLHTYQFLEKVGENQHVSAYPVTADDMKDYNKFFDVLYTDFKGGNFEMASLFSR